MTPPNLAKGGIEIEEQTDNRDGGVNGDIEIIKHGNVLELEGWWLMASHTWTASAVKPPPPATTLHGPVWNKPPPP